MEAIYYESSLCHHGIKGQKWGVRRFQDDNGKLTSAGRRRYVDDATKKYDKDIHSFDAYRKTGISDKKGRTLLTKEDVNKSVNALKERKAKAAAKAGKKYDRALRKQRIKDTTKKLESTTSLREKLIYSPGTRKQAAKYVVDNNMSVKEARMKANGDAWKNTAAFVASFATASLALKAYKDLT